MLNHKRIAQDKPIVDEMGWVEFLNFLSSCPDDEIDHWFAVQKWETSPLWHGSVLVYEQGDYQLYLQGGNTYEIMHKETEQHLCLHGWKALAYFDKLVGNTAGSYKQWAKFD